MASVTPVEFLPLLLHAGIYHSNLHIYRPFIILLPDAQSHFRRTALPIPCFSTTLQRSLQIIQTSRHFIHYAVLAFYCSSIACTRDVLFANISLETPANLFDREFSSSSTTAESSAGADASVVVCINKLTDEKSTR